jgi:hypothetical protein
MRKGNKVDRWLVTGLVLFLFGLLLLIIFTGPGKTSDVSNWVSTFANIAKGLRPSWPGAPRESFFQNFLRRKAIDWQ